MEHTLLCLHGWGGSKESFDDLRRALSGSAVEILTPDLPGFGSQPQPDRPWKTDDFADWVERWMNGKWKKENGKLFLLGHSHGGRIAIALAARGNLKIEYLYLVAAAGVPHAPTMNEYLGLMAAKIGSGIFSIPGLKPLRTKARSLLYSVLGVHDYERASPLMRLTLQIVTKEDLRPRLRDIHVPTSIFWGTKDTQTPLKEGKIIHAGISGSRMTIFPDARHRIHRDHAAEIAAEIRKQCSVLSPTS